MKLTLLACMCHAGAVVESDIHTLDTELAGWVLHVLCFIVPRQICTLGDSSRRSSDACESFGAVLKKTIKHLNCRRRIQKDVGTHMDNGKVTRVNRPSNAATPSKHFVA
eukprot:6173043-Pleurochrysis_carterae.AAC.2